MLPQGDLPVGGASISILVNECPSHETSVDPLSVCADRRVKVFHGMNIERSTIMGPTSIPGSRALRLSLDLPLLGEPAQRIHTTLIFWRSEGNVIDIELSYIEGDRNSRKHEQAAYEIFRSFKVI